VTQEFPVSVVQSAKKPRRRKPKEIWKRPVVIGVSVVGVIGVLVLFISNSPPRIQDGLVAYYPFNGNAQDESGNGHHGTVDDAALGIDRFDSLDKSYGFNSAGRIRIPDDHLLDIKDNDSLTISVWVFFVPGANRQFIVSKQNTVPIDGRSPCYFLHLNHQKEGELQLVVQDRRQRQVTVTSSISKLPYGKWRHLVAVIAKSRASGGLFLDGVAMTSDTTQEIFLSNKHQPTDEFVQSLENDGDLFLGSGRDKHHFNGHLDDIRIYNRALSAAEVKALYDFESKPPASPRRTVPAIESTTNTIGMTLNKIPAGTFMMGSPEGEPDRSDNEHQHKVTISKPFYMQTTEVTQEQWKEVMGTEPWKGAQFVKEGPNYAATWVSWDDAVAYCEKLSQKESKTYRLPTEAEWEYACRAGTETRWSFSNDEKDLGDYAWHKENARDIGEEYAHQVGLKKPNAFGLYDMHGNVWEWCHDYFEADYYERSPEQDPRGPQGSASDSSRVLRGGSWFYETRYARFASRNRSDKVRYLSVDFGFRLVRELD
jgi:formylglycine-generating enzyme required for sulfatase activity